MVGSRTVETDDPMLTTRTAEGEGRDATRIIVDGDARLSPERQVFRLQSPAPTIVAIKKSAPADRKSALSATGAELIELESKNGKIDLAELVKKLGQRNIASVMIEGGGGLLGAAFEAKIVDKILFFIAPKIFGGKGAPTPVEGTGVGTVGEAVQLKDLSIRRFADDILVEGYVIK
jgi:diaminohydroxyphosphoribosylaminopyrimidine deaminase/5-amino-6-(5-phosphoribosylamino)uracil reductase